MTDTISADYSLRPSELASTLALLVEARQPVVVWGAPGCAKSQIARQVAAQAGREYVDVRALLLDPVDLRGIPWRDGADRTRWAPPAFLPPSDADGSWLINLEELPSALPMVQAALYQLVLDRKCGEYELPEGAALIACGNREGDRGVVHRLPALVAAVTGDDGVIEGVQRTWLDPKRPAKANLARPRKALGRVHGRVVRFGGFASGATLLAGEGIETVLSLVTAVPRIHAAAALSAGSLGAFEPPQDLALLVIARDKDVQGEHAANRLQHRCVERGIPSIVIVPEHSDFNDDLIAIGEETLAARIATLIASSKSAATGEERRGSGRIINPS